VNIESCLDAHAGAPRRYAIALGIFGAALALRLLVLKVDAPVAFLTFYPAAVLTFLLAGSGPGRVVVAFSAVAGFYIFMPPHWSFEPTRASVLAVAVFIGSGLLIGWIIERLRDTVSRLQATMAALQVTEHRYRSIVEEQTELVSLAHPDGQLVYVNAAYARHFGCTPAQCIGTNLFDLVDTADRAAVAQQIDDVLHSDTPRSGENRMRGTDGAEKWVAWTNSVQRDASGARLLHSVGRDITERRQLELRLADSERFMRLITDSLPLRIAYVDQDQRIRFLNLTESQTFGRRRAEIIGHRRSEILPGAMHPDITRRVEAALAGQPQQFEFDEKVAGELRRIDCRLIPDIAPCGEVRGYVSTGRDITADVEARHELQRQTETLRSVAEAIPAGVTVVGADARYRFVNNAFERWCGKPRADIIGRTAPEVMGEVEFRRRWPWAQRALAGEAVTFTLDYPGTDGSIYLSLSYVPLHLDNGAVDGFVVVIQDVTGHKREALRLLELAQHDPLTGLLNRAGLEQYLALDVLAGRGRSIAVLYIDLDHFKPVNDRYGHPVGDELLRLFAQRLRNLVRPTDAVARLGGDEFVIVLLGIDEPGNAQLVADKVLAAAREPFHIGAQLLRVGASVGVAHGIDATHEWRDLVVRADAQLLIAKAAGRGRLMVEGH
jgi:diguanylate cyclase (GGDEF)-like protein/PAS domain S-box-containing protein